jgi:hypothetical protein
VQARAMGQLSSLEDIRAIVRASSELVQFDPAHTEQWSDAYARFLGFF